MKRCPAEIDAARQPDLACLQSLLFDEEQEPAGLGLGGRRGSPLSAGDAPGGGGAARSPLRQLPPVPPCRAGQDVQKRGQRVLQGEGLRQGRRILQRGAEEEVRGRGAQRRAAHQQGGRALPPG